MEDGQTSVEIEAWAWTIFPAVVVVVVGKIVLTDIEVFANAIFDPCKIGKVT